MGSDGVPRFLGSRIGDELGLEKVLLCLSLTRDPDDVSSKWALFRVLFTCTFSAIITGWSSLFLGGAIVPIVLQIWCKPLIIVLFVIRLVRL